MKAMGICLIALLFSQACAEQFFGEDAWTDAEVSIFRSHVAKQPKCVPVKVEFRGGTAVPREQMAGSKVRLRFDYRGVVPDVAFLPLVLALETADGSLKWKEELEIALPQSLRRVVDDVWALEFDYELPRYLDSCKVFVRCSSPCLSPLKDGDAAARLQIYRIETDPEWAKPLVATVKDVAGSPWFAIDGRPVYPLWGLVNSGRREVPPRRHSSAPLNFATVQCNHLRYWPKGEKFDPSELDRAAEEMRRAFRDAYFIWDVSIYPPPDWRDANPDEMARDEQGFVNRDIGDSEINYSFASRKAYDDMERIVRKVIAHVEQSPYANRVIGYRINSGHTIEWLGWDPTRKSTILDFSPAAQKGFEAFAKEHYPWITDYSVPTLAERRELDADGGVLWDQRRHARTIAFHDFYSTAVADGIIRMCGIAKEMVGSRKLVGTYYGYVMTLNVGGRDQMRAHFATKHLIDAKAVDFLCSPQEYTPDGRMVGRQIQDMKPFRTLQDNGIVSVIEDDTRTHNAWAWGPAQAFNETMTVNVLRRNMGVSLCRNQPFYTYGIISGVDFDFPKFADDAAVLAAAGRHAIDVGVGRNAEIAVVVSEEAIKSTPMSAGRAENYVGYREQIYDGDGKVVRQGGGGAQNAAWQYSRSYTQCARIGAGFDLLLAEDLVDHPGDYRLYIMQSCTKLTPALVEAAAALRKRKCTILWTYAPGYTSNEGNSVENMRKLTGVDFTLCQNVTDPGVTLEDGTTVGSLVYPKGVRPLSPIFAMADPDKVWGRYSDGSAGLAEKRTGEARTIFSGSYYMMPPLLQRIAREAGVHVFSDTFDFCESNERFLSFHARNAGEKTIRLPRRTTVVDVFSRKLVAKDVEAFSFFAPLHSSFLFYFGDDAEELLAKIGD